MTRTKDIGQCFSIQTIQSNSLRDEHQCVQLIGSIGSGIAVEWQRTQPLPKLRRFDSDRESRPCNFLNLIVGILGTFGKNVVVWFTIQYHQPTNPF